MNKKFCYLCGHKLSIKNNEYFECTNCGQTIFENPKPCVEIVLFNEKGEVLISKRLNEPYKGKFDLPGGFVDKNDNYNSALEREVKEELNLEISQLKDVRYIGSYNAPYPWINETYNVAVAEFMAEIDSETKITASDDVESVQWVKVSDLQQFDFSLPQVLEMINLALNIRSKNA